LLDTSWVPAGHFIFDLAAGAGVGLSKTLRVTRVDPGSSAARAGVAKGFRLVSFAGGAVATLADFKEALQREQQASNRAKGCSVEFERPAAAGMAGRAKAAATDESCPPTDQVGRSRNSAGSGATSSAGATSGHERDPQLQIRRRRWRPAKAAAAKASFAMRQAAQVAACRVLSLPALSGLVATFLQSINDDDAIAAAARHAAASGRDGGGGRTAEAGPAATTLSLLAQFMDWMTSAVAEGCRDFLKAEVDRAGVRPDRSRRRAANPAQAEASGDDDDAAAAAAAAEYEASWAEAAANAAVDGVRRAVEVEVFVPAARALRRRLRAAEEADEATATSSAAAYPPETAAAAAARPRRDLGTVLVLPGEGSSGNIGSKSSSSSSSSRGSSAVRGNVSEAAAVQRACEALSRAPGDVGPRGGQARLGLPVEHRSPSGWDPVRSLTHLFSWVSCVLALS
jgi:hypothetical protein